jgi:hypothetical protein
VFDREAVVAKNATTAADDKVYGDHYSADSEYAL